MQIPAWKIATWSEVCISVHDWDVAAEKLRHLGTTAHHCDDRTGLRRGQAFWASEAANDIVGLAWDWAEVQPGVVAMADPMTILCNAILIDEDGRPVDPYKRILHLNNCVFSIPWQQQIRAPRTVPEQLAA